MYQYDRFWGLPSFTLAGCGAYGDAGCLPWPSEVQGRRQCTFWNYLSLESHLGSSESERVRGTGRREKGHFLNYYFLKSCVKNWTFQHSLRAVSKDKR